MTTTANRPVRSVAVLGADYQGLRPAPMVAAGDRVAAGQVLLADRAHPRVTLVAPVAGTVVSVDYGPRRSLSALILDCDADPDAPEAPAAPAPPPDMTTRAGLRDALLSHGLWPALRTRPFGRFPAPDETPDAIFVTATDSAPLAPDPRALLAGRERDFAAGVRLLALLTDGPVFVCQSAGPPLAEETPRIRNVIFGRAHPAGLASTHIQMLHPVGFGRTVWTIEGQEAAAIGQLAETGRHDPARSVAVTGPQMPEPRVIRTLPGAALHDIVGGATGARSGASLPGASLPGGGAAWLGRFDRQITLAGPERRRRWPGWLAPRGAGPALRPIIPTAALERALPPHILPVPLMRALSVADTEAAERLGALALIEEDMALLSALCTSGADYGALLRHVLNDLEAAA